MKVPIFLMTLLTHMNVAYSAPTSPELAVAGCNKLKSYITENAPLGVKGRYVQVPMEYQNPIAGERTLIFVWGRPAKNPEYPPLVFFHGGTGGNSNMIFEMPKMKNLLETYPGGFYALDLRGESCSKPEGLRSDLHPFNYKAFNLVNTALDIEFLRLNGYFGKADKIRIFGQSRGAALVHHYFSLFPNAVESAHAHGFSVQPTENDGMNGVQLRAEAMLNAWRNYTQKFPDDAALAKRIKSAIPKDKCWTGIDETQICGPESLGILGIVLARPTAHESIHKALLDMTDEKGNPSQEKIFKIIGERWLTTSYKEFNYVMGTNGYDIASLGSGGATQLKDQKDAAYFEAPFSEVRFINEAIVKQYRDSRGNLRDLDSKDTLESYKPISYEPIVASMKTFFENGTHFRKWNSRRNDVRAVH